jgi:hypothetical protein
VQLYRYFVSQSSEFCRHNHLCCFPTSVHCYKRTFYRLLSPETFGYTHVCFCVCVCVCTYARTYEGVSKSFRTGRLARELQMVQLSATRCSCIAILWVSIVSFATITLCVASQWVFIVVSVYFIDYSVRKLLDTRSYIMERTSFEEPPLFDDVRSRWNRPTAGPSRHLCHLQQKHTSSLITKGVNKQTNKQHKQTHSTGMYVLNDCNAHFIGNYLMMLFQMQRLFSVEDDKMIMRSEMERIQEEASSRGLLQDVTLTFAPNK